MTELYIEQMSVICVVYKVAWRELVLQTLTYVHIYVCLLDNF